MITIDKQAVRNFNIFLEMTEYASTQCPHGDHSDQTYFTMPAGVEHYRLLGYISGQFNNETLIDVGSRFGGSAIALSFNLDNNVISYDVRNRNPAKTRANVEFRIVNILEDRDEFNKLLSSPFIMFDIQEHNGKDEKEFIQRLHDENWAGILMLDDISPAWPEMELMWESIDLDYPKYDLTDIGHKTGTHILDFSKGLKIV